MIYVRNRSHKIIHLADVMLLPDEKVPDLMPGTDKKYSDNDVIKQFIRMGMLELVDVRPIEKAPEEPEIKVEYEDVPEEEPVSVPASAPEEAEERTDSVEEPASKPEETKSQTRRRKAQTKG